MWKSRTIYRRRHKPVHLLRLDKKPHVRADIGTDMATPQAVSSVSPCDRVMTADECDMIEKKKSKRAANRGTYNSILDANSSCIRRHRVLRMRKWHKSDGGSWCDTSREPSHTRELAEYVSERRDTRKEGRGT